jgi:hypothetical protein
MEIRKTIRLRRKRRHGMALLTVMIVLMIIFAVSLMGVAAGTGGVAGTTQTGLTATRLRLQSAEALNLAENGVNATLQWLTNQTAPPQFTSAFAPANFWGGTVVNGYSQVTFSLGEGKTGTFRVRMYPYSQNATEEQKNYLIESIGSYQGREVIMRVVATQDTFAKYAYFIDHAPVTNSWWVSGSTKFYGPVHVNATVDDGGTPRTANILWKYSTSSSTQDSNKIFMHDGADAFTTSADRINWAKGDINTPADPSTTTDWKNIALGGANTVRTSVTRVPLPEESTKQQDSARGTMSPTTMASNPMGVYLPPNGGIYIRGDVNNLDMSTSGAVNGLLHQGGTGDIVQTFTIYQTDTATSKEVRWTVTVNPVTNTTTLQKATASLNSTSFGSNTTVATVTGTTNKVLFCDGNIGRQGNPNADPVVEKSGGLSGNIANNWGTPGNFQNENSWTVATPSNKSVNIDDNIRYRQDSFMGNSYNNNPTKMSGTLGIVSGKVQVVDQRSDAIGRQNGSWITGATIHATVVAFDTFDVTNFLTRGYTGSTIGQNITILGGYICKNNGNFGTIFSNGNLRSGFTRTLRYDARVAYNPPPSFPTTANRYILSSLQRVTSTLE